MIFDKKNSVEKYVWIPFLTFQFSSQGFLKIWNAMQKIVCGSSKEINEDAFSTSQQKSHHDVNLGERFVGLFAHFYFFSIM